ncbi:hypothetical protein KFU94_60310 [Chloroflexi bacterium TSY]|nr:hypothetical protein [Chloroflexi bacterium TSY]
MLPHREEKIQIVQARRVIELRCHAREGDAYTKRLYARLASAISKEKNRWGDICILHANSVENVVALSNRRRKSQIVSALEPTIAS